MTRKESPMDVADRVERNFGLVYACVGKTLGIDGRHPWYDAAVSDLSYVLWRCARQFDPGRGAKFSTFAYGAMRREAGHWLRRRVAAYGFGMVGKRDVKPPLSLGEPAPDDDGCLGDVIPDRRAPTDFLLWSAVGEPLRLRFAEGRPWASVGECLGVSPEAARDAARRALRRLKKELCEERPC